MSVTKLKIVIECKMQEVWGLGYFINPRNRHVCYMKFYSVPIFHQMRDMKYVTYLYQLSMCCQELVLILHGVKLTRCKICSSTELSLLALIILKRINIHVI